MNPNIKLMPDNKGIEVLKYFVQKGSKETKQSNIHCVSCVLFDYTNDSKYWYIDIYCQDKESINNAYYGCYCHDNASLDKCVLSGGMSQSFADKIKNKKEEANNIHKDNVVFFTNKSTGMMFDEKSIQ